MVALIVTAPLDAKAVEAGAEFAALYDAAPSVASKGAEALSAFAQAGELYVYEQRIEFGYSAMLDPAWVQGRIEQHYDALAAELASDAALSAQLELRPLLWRVELVGVKTVYRIWVPFAVKKTGKGFVEQQAGVLHVGLLIGAVAALVFAASVLTAALKSDPKELAQSVAFAAHGLPTSLVTTASGETIPVQSTLAKFANPFVAIPVAAVVLVGAYFGAPLLKRFFRG